MSPDAAGLAEEDAAGRQMRKKVGDAREARRPNWVVEAVVEGPSLGWQRAQREAHNRRLKMASDLTIVALTIDQRRS